MTDLFGPDGKLNARELGIVYGVDPVAAHDQVKAEALIELRGAEGFLLVTFNDDGADRLKMTSIMSFDGAEAQVVELLLTTAEWLQEAVADYLTRRRGNPDG